MLSVLVLLLGTAHLRHNLLVQYLDSHGLRESGRQGLEVGVWMGNFSRAQLENGAQTLRLVDSWRHLRSWNKPWNIDDASFAKKYAAVRELVDEFGANRVIIHRGTSQEAAPTFADHSLDYIYIDGDHTVAGAVADCLLWWPKLKPGGLFFGDDYMCSEQHGKSFAMTCVKDVVDTFAKVSWHANVSDLGLHQFAIWKGS
tara:strand:- start:272 stop:871 length:600 start_codon:yes stop_codon:yes gene_type:complete